MISGAHVIIYSQDADADRALFRDVLGLHNIDVGEGWLIFALPPSEIAFHPSESSTKHEVYLMCEDIAEFIAKVSAHGVEHTEVKHEGWGLLSSVTLPGGAVIGVYEPKHDRPSES